MTAVRDPVANALIQRWRAELAVWRAGPAGRGAARCGAAGAAELLVVSERLARRGVARGHGLAYDLNE